MNFDPIWKVVDATARDDVERAVEVMFEEWSAALPNAVLKMFEGAENGLQALLDCIEVVLKWATRPPPFKNYRVPAAVTSFFMKLHGRLRDGDLEEQYQKVLSALDGMSHEDRIGFWHAVLDAIQHHSHPADVVIAVYDNADPMDEPLQQAIQHRLDIISTTCVHKLVAPVRPVAFEVRAFSTGFNSYVHSGPSPLDILSQRLLAFVVHPELSQVYRESSREDRRRALTRALDLLLRLQRCYGYGRSLGPILSWMAGDSGRRILGMAKEVFRSNALLEQRDVLALADNIGQLRGRYELRMMVDRLAASLAEEIVAAAEDVAASVARHDPVTPEEIADRLVGTVKSVIANIQRVQRSSMLEISASDAVATLREGEITTAARSTVQEAMRHAAEVLERPVGASPWYARAIGRLRKLFIDGVNAEFHRLDWRHPGAPEAAIHFVQSLVEDRDAPPPTQPPADVTDRAVRQFLEVNKPFLPVQILLSNPTHTVNLFVSEGRPSLCKLQVLWDLAAAGGQVRLGQLLETLESLGHSEFDIIGTVDEFVNENRRLMWLDRRFRHGTMAALKEHAGRPAVLSRAGWGYHGGLGSEIDYLLVKLGQGGNLTGQIADVADGLRRLHELEDEQRRRTDLDRLPPNVLTAVRDIALRAAPQFLDLSLRHCRKMERRSECEQLRASVIAYERLLGEFQAVSADDVTQRRQLFRSVGPERARPRKIVVSAERARFREALAGAALWRDGMKADEYHL
jgi:hypothetical protein